MASGVSVNDNCQIGKDCHLNTHVSVYHGCQIGNRVIIHSGAVIGSDGFGIANAAGKWLKIAQIGAVVIADDVEIGANTTIDRGALANTTIGQGVKLDNQIQIGHNVVIGDHTAVAGCVAIAGSTEIGRHCMIGGGTCIAGHLKITDRVNITGMSGVASSILIPGNYSSGMLIQKNKAWLKNSAQVKRLHKYVDRIAALEQQVTNLTESLEGKE